MGPENKTAHARALIAPFPFVVGLMLAFGGCCLAGRVVSEQNYYEDYIRFHCYINMATQYHPTPCQVRALAKSRLDPRKITVVVGGSSVLYGTGQRAEQVWSRKLQDLLGAQYQVINFGAPGADLIDFGGVAAEILSHDFPKLLFISDSSADRDGPALDGRQPFKPFFWRAHAKDLLVADPDREQALRDLAATSGLRNLIPELEAQANLDNIGYFNDLWTTIAYTQFSTVWNVVLPGSFMKPRKRFCDPETGPNVPFAQRYALDRTAATMARLRSTIAKTELDLADPTRLVAKEKKLKATFPEACRKRTLVLTARISPFYLDQLEPWEKALFDRGCELCAETFRKAGYEAFEIEKRYPVTAFNDSCHLSEEGGTLLAAEVAPKICALAARLGFTDRD